MFEKEMTQTNHRASSPLFASLPFGAWISFRISGFGFRVSKLPIGLALAACIGLPSLAGCGSNDARFRQNMAFKRKMERQNLAGEEGEVLSLSDDITRDVADILAGLFGTPDDPQLPVVEGVDNKQLAVMRRLKMAAGPVGSDADGRPHGLYREHCGHCHGISGDGAGPTAEFLNPYPRDYRLGLYKFKSTKKGEKPTHEDLTRVVLNGIPGTAMPSFALLPEYEVEALVDYVRYLSIRGEVERELFRYATTELEDPYDSLYGDYTSLSEKLSQLKASGASKKELGDAESRLYQSYRQLYRIRSSTKAYEPESGQEIEKLSGEEVSTNLQELKDGVAQLEKSLAEYHPPRLLRPRGEDGSEKSGAELKQQMAPYVEIAGTVMQKWIGPQSVAVPEPPNGLDPNDRQSIARGREIFYGPIANCFSCHGESGLGDGQRDFFDEWSGEWVEKNAPEATEEYVHLGALPPRNLVPRNLRLGVYRGGRRPVDLYWRLVNGIDGAQMPAVPMLAADAPPGSKGLTQQDLWDLINYVRSLPYESISQSSRAETQLAKEIQ